jgi:hypothetical protein
LIGLIGEDGGLPVFDRRAREIERRTRTRDDDAALAIEIDRRDAIAAGEVAQADEGVVDARDDLARSGGVGDRIVPARGGVIDLEDVVAAATAVERVAVGLEDLWQANYLS